MPLPLPPLRRLTTPLQLLLLLAVITTVFAPLFRAEPCLLDDLSLVRTWLAAPHSGLPDLFPGNGITYYRPLIWAGYWLDGALWQLNPRIMHAENLLLHLLNCLLLFALLRRLLTPPGWWPLVGALLFGLHPIVTESVCWISGRTDLLAATGLLAALWCLLQGQATGHRRWFLLALPALLAAGLAKEVAWGALLGLPLLLTPRTAPLPPHQTTSRHYYAVGCCLAGAFLLASLTASFWPVLALALVSWGIWHHRYAAPDRSLRRSALLTLLLAGSLLALLLIGLAFCRRLALQNPFSPVGQTLLAMVTHPDHALQVTASAAAFYLKKYLLPLPLALAITAIDGRYVFGGILALFLMAWLAARRTQATALAFTGICLLLPVLPLAFGTIAWTPYAERYLYLPAAFFTLALVQGCATLPHPRLRTALLCALATLLPLAAWISHQRALVWQRNLTLFADTVAKAPNHLESRNGYLIALAQAGRLDQAKGQFEAIQRLVKGPDEMKYAYNLVYFTYHAGQKREAYDLLTAIVHKWRIIPERMPQSFYSTEWRKLYELQQQLGREVGQPPEKP